MTINLTALQKQRYDTAANWTGANPTLLAGEIGIESDTLRWKVGNGSTAWTSLAYIPGLTYGTARQLLQTNSGATGAEWTSNVDIPGTLDVTGTSTLDGMVLIGTTTSIGGGKFQVSSDTATTLQNFSFNSSANSNTASLQFVRARGTKASPSIVLNDDYIGEIRFIGYGTTYNTGASIRAIVDGDPATSGDSSDMPTKLVFLTSPNGSATPDTRMTIDSAGLVTIPGDLTVNGTTTTINSTTLVVQDKNIEMGVVATPTDVTADGGGITLKGTTDKTINWIDATDAWTFSEHVNIASAKEYRIAGTKVLDATSLGSAVVSSSLTSVGTIGTGVWQGTAIADTYLGTISTALKVSNSATTATSANTASAIVARDASGNFTAGTITANLTGTASNVTTNANLTGDVTSVGNATTIAAGVIVDADINASAAIVDTKLATIATAGKVSNSATTATDANTASAIVARDASGNFTAGTITAALTGAASSNVLKAGDTMTGALVVPLGAVGTPSLTFAGDTSTGIYSPGAYQVAVATNGTGRLFVDASGNVGLGITPVANTFIGGARGSAIPALIELAGNGNTVGATGFVFGQDGSGVGILFQRSNAAMAFSTNGTERLRITAAGLVGIGTSSPGSKLEVFNTGTYGTAFQPSIYITNSSSGGTVSANTGLGAITWATDSNANLVSSIEAIRENPGSGAASALVLRTGSSGGGTERLRITSAGNVGIGTTSPARVFHVSGSGTTTRLTSSTSTSTLEFETTGGFAYVGAKDGPNVYIETNGSERARIDSSGRLLVGTSTTATTDNNANSPNIQLEGASGDASRMLIRCNGGTTAGNSGFLYIARSRGTTANSKDVVVADDSLGGIIFEGTDGTHDRRAASILAEVDGTPGANDMPGRLVFSTTPSGSASPSPRMTITSGGAVLIGMTSDNYLAADSGIQLKANGTARFGTDGTSATNVLSFVNGTNGTPAEVGVIQTSGSSTSYNTASDYRLKENVVPLTNAVSRLNQLRVHRFNFIADPGKTVDGFVAHEAQAVVPECATGTKDAVNDDGNPIYQGIDQAKLVPLLTAALQEAIGEINALKDRVAALEGA